MADERQPAEQLHALEQRFQMPAREILDVVLNNNRTLMNLKGAIAEEHLKRQLDALARQGQIEDFAPIDADGKPDFWVQFRGRRLYIECKNVLQQRPKQLSSKRMRKADDRIKVDFWRTRNQGASGDRYGRYYAEGEFDVLAACLFNRTGEWMFRYIEVNRLTRLDVAPTRFRNKVVVDLGEPSYGPYWSDALVNVLDRLVAR